ncbi:methyltransferase domain-containing protein [Leptothoe sp. EHU-05/26/07-4]
MPSSLDLDHYKRAIAESYDRRSSNYDKGEWRKRVCDHLLSYSQVSLGQSVLDIGTGTGYLAIAAAKKVGTQGSVVGVDLSSEMLKKARSKAKAAELSNLQFQLADAEELIYQDACFDYILCANTFPWISNKEAVLKSWYRFLKPGGQIAVHTPADTAYVGSVVLRKVLATYDIEVEPSNRTGSIEQCQKLFDAAGFRSIKIKQEQHGSYIKFESALATWQGVIEAPSALSLKVSNGISQLSPTQLEKVKLEFESALSGQQTEKGIWDDLTTLYVLGQKPDAS